MSQATKRKYVAQEILSEFPEPTAEQRIAQVSRPRVLAVCLDLAVFNPHTIDTAFLYTTISRTFPSLIEDHSQ